MSTFEFIGDSPDLFNININGKRVRLVSISNKFEQDIFNEFTSEITTYMFPQPAKTIKETRDFIDSSLEGFKEGNNLQLVILRKENDEFLGCCGLHGDEDARNPEFGIWLKKSAHGEGLGKEAIHTLAFWAQVNIRLDSFVYPVDKRNQPSRNIPISLGGTIIEERTVQGVAGNTLNEVVYKIPLPLVAT